MGDFYKPAHAYAFKLLEKWGELMDLSEDFRKNMLLGIIDQELTMEYISRLTRLWLELYPKIRGRTDLDLKLVKEFEQFKKYFEDPILLKNPKEAQNLFKFEEMLRWAIEELELTNIEED